MICGGLGMMIGSVLLIYESTNHPILRLTKHQSKDKTHVGVA